jgi:RHS repeat-associated protein
MAAIGNTNVDAWGWAEFKRARIRHWLRVLDPWDGGHQHFSDTLAWEQSPSPDGTVEGQVTWYDYPGKDPNHLELIGTGTEMPGVIARVLPDGSTSYQYFEHNALGLTTLLVQTYTKTDGTIGTRTNSFEYASNGIDMTRQIGPLGEQVVSNRFDAFHHATNSFDALNQLTKDTYNANGQLTSIVRPTGLTTTNLYFSGGVGIGRLDTTIDLEIRRTNAFTYYPSGLVLNHTDERGLTTTSFWDGLDRLAGISFSDGTTTSNLYARGATKLLDLTGTKDRLGYWTYFDYNGIRQKIAETNANGVVTRYGYCECGSLLSLTNAWNTPIQQVTLYSYDSQGHRTNTIFADEYSVTNWFNTIGQLIETADGWGTNGFSYNNQGSLTTNRNNYGPVQITVCDIEDRPVYVTDANGVTVTNTFDALGRLSTRGYPDGGIEKFGYSARGLVAYTNQLGFTNFYAYDEASRKTFETNANSEIIRYTNNSAGDLLSLTDGKNQTTRWGYDEYGRVTNKFDQIGAEILRYKYDADSRLTNRWSAAKGETHYTLDPMGNLTYIDYPTNTDVSFQYDWLNRLTNMADASGTTTYTYTPGNQLLTEDGPWANDTVTNTYVNRLRTSLSLQQPSGLWTNAFVHDAARRLSAVLCPAGTFGYNYRSGLPSLMPKKVLIPGGGGYITNTFDGNSRLTGTFLKNSFNATLDSYSYAYDPANERTNLTRSDGSAVVFTYDPIGQLKVADSSVNAEDRGYAYDAAWNLNWRTNNGSLSTFTVDTDNQLTGFPDPGGTTVGTTYDLNGNLLFATAFDWENDYVYDDENRLIGFAAWRSPGGGLPASRVSRSDFLYDGLGRLRTRAEYSWNGTAWVFVSTNEYVYDGWRVIQERDASNNPIVSYTRGTDLSGSLEGAGGIGGLLARSHGYSSGNWTNHNFYQADGNGNITFMINGSQAMVARYRYDPFGNLISQSGSLANANVYRFSSKEIHVASGMYYYGFRFYDPNLQRWIDRDPIASSSPGLEVTLNRGMAREYTLPGHLSLAVSPSVSSLVSLPAVFDQGHQTPFEALSPNLYAYCGNLPVTAVDGLGLWYIDVNLTVGFVAGVTGGVQIDRKGLHPYAGPAITSPGRGFSCMWSPDDPSPKKWSKQLAAGAGLGGAFGSDEDGNVFREVGGMWPPGFSYSWYYTFF